MKIAFSSSLALIAAELAGDLGSELSLMSEKVFRGMGGWEGGGVGGLGLSWGGGGGGTVRRALSNFPCFILTGIMGIIICEYLRLLHVFGGAWRRDPHPHDVRRDT